MTRAPLPTWTHALVVVRRAERFLLVQEAKHGNTWYLPAGAVEPGESFAAAAEREAREEAGIDVVLRGIYRVEHTPGLDGARLRVIFAAEPADDRPPKDRADEHSLRAAWMTLEELRSRRLRGPELERLFADVARGAPVYPLSLIEPLGAPLLE